MIIVKKNNDFILKNLNNILNIISIPNFEIKYNYDKIHKNE